MIGISRPVPVLHREAKVEHIVNIAAIAVADPQDKETRRKRARIAS